MTVLGLGSLAVGVFVLITDRRSDPGLLAATVLGAAVLWIGVTIGKHPERSLWALGLGFLETALWSYRFVIALDFRTLAFLIIWIGFLTLALAAAWSIRNRSFENDIRGPRA